MEKGEITFKAFVWFFIGVLCSVILIIVLFNIISLLPNEEEIDPLVLDRFEDLLTKIDYIQKSKVPEAFELYITKEFSIVGFRKQGDADTFKGKIPRPDDDACLNQNCLCFCRYMDCSKIHSCKSFDTPIVDSSKGKDFFLDSRKFLGAFSKGYVELEISYKDNAVQIAEK